MRFLLLSDTHGNLSIVNELAAEVEADAVIHAGDFGFYDDDSYERISDRELRLHITHSELDAATRDEILALPREQRNEACRKLCPLSELPLFIEGRQRFDIPVYAVWGNHEDKEVVERLFRSELQLPNLFVLSHRKAYEVGPVLVYGVGGNHLPGPKMLQSPIAGGSGRIWSTLSQYVDLITTVEEHAGRSGPRIFVTHVSPGKEPFIELLAARTRADFTVSGHMGAPCPMIWNQFAVRPVEEAVHRLQRAMLETKQSCLEARGSDPERVEQAFSGIGQIPDETIRLGRGARVPRWYCSMTHINLPDADVGYAVIDVTETGVAIRTATT